MNMVRLKLILCVGSLLTGLALLPGCGKNGGVCLSDSGTVSRQRREVGEFDSIDLADNMTLVLTQDTFSRVEVESGKNLFGGISTTVKNRELIIRNNNTCNWVRSYSKPLNVYATVKNLVKIYYNSSGNVSTTNTINSGYLKLDIWGGCGVLDLDVNVVNGFFILHMGTATITLRGICQVSSVYSGDYGLVQLKQLQTGYTFVTNRGSNDCYVNANHYVEAWINSVGNVYYTGNPPSVTEHITGTGKLLPF